MFLTGPNSVQGIVPDFKVERYQFTVNKYQGVHKASWFLKHWFDHP